MKRQWELGSGFPLVAALFLWVGLFGVYSCARAQQSVLPGYQICSSASGSTICSFQPVDLTHPLPVSPMSGTSGGATPYHLVAANTNNSTSLKASAGVVYSVQLGGVGSAPAYLKLYDKATAPTCQTDAVVAQFIIPAAATAANGGGSNVSIPVGKNFTAGIGFCVVTGIADNDNTAVAAATFIINIDWK